MSKASDVPDSLRKELSNRSNQQPSIPVSLSTNLGGSPYQPNMLAANKMFMEMQRRMYASALSQQQQNQQNGRNEEENTTIVQDAVMKDFARFIQTLNEKFMHAVQKAPFIGLRIMFNLKFRSPQTFILPRPRRLCSNN